MSNSSDFDGFHASLAAQAIRIVVNGLVILLLTRYLLTPDEYGLLFLILAIFGSSLLFSRLGIQNSAARYVTEYRELDPGQVRNIVRTSLAAIGVTSLLVAVSLVIFREPIAGLFDEPSLAPLLALGFFYVCFRTLNNYMYKLFQGLDFITRSALISICSQLGILVGVVSLTALGYGVMGALSGYVVGYSAGTFVGVVLLFRTLRGYDVEPMESGLRRRILEYSFPLAVTNAANILYKRVDILLVGFFLTPLAVAYYTLARQLSDFMIAPADALGFTISPSYGEYKAKDDTQRAAEIYEVAFEHTILFYIPAAVGLVLVAEPAVEYVFGEDYLGAVPVIQVLSIFIVLQALDKITNDGLDYLGRAKHRAIVKMSTGGLNFGLNLVLIPTIGVVGAAISTVIGYGIMMSINIYLIHVELSLRLRRLLRSLTLVVGISICMAAIVFVLSPLITNLVTLLVVVGIGGGVWAVLALASGIPEIELPKSSISV